MMKIALGFESSLIESESTIADRCLRKGMMVLEARRVAKIANRVVAFVAQLSFLFSLLSVLLCVLLVRAQRRGQSATQRNAHSHSNPI